MLETLNKVAKLLTQLKWPSMVAAILTLLAVLTFAARPAIFPRDDLLLPLIVAFLWFASLYGLVSTFGEIPRRVVESDSFWLKVRIRLYRAYFWGLGAVFLGTSLAVIVLSVRLARIWLVTNLPSS